MLLGVVGICVPVLPTTPFILLAVLCYLHSSEKLYEWLIHHKAFGAYIFNYMTYRAVLRSTKIGAMIFLWMGLIISTLIINNWYIRGILFLVGAGVSIHLLTLKTIKKSEIASPDNEDEKQEKPV